MYMYLQVFIWNEETHYRYIQARQLGYVSLFFPFPSTRFGERDESFELVVRFHSLLRLKIRERRPSEKKREKEEALAVLLAGEKGKKILVLIERTQKTLTVLHFRGVV